MKPLLGEDASAKDVAINLERLIETRLVLTAISGGGKSHAIRRILEQTHGHVQQIVIDPEGEFYSLREQFPYIIAGRPNGAEGDCPAEVRSANLLALKLLELRVSAIVDIYSLSADPSDPGGRIPFVKAFLQSLLSAPKNLYHPCLVVLDEAHIFSPEKGEGEAASRGSVIRLMSEGRKKLLCGILATQRLSKLDKSAISEAHNMMIGKSTLDVDVDRARRYLGFRKGDDLLIRRMARGHFWSFGPAISDEVIDVMVADTITKTPKIGSRASAPAPPSDAIQKILGKLADLPEEVARKEQTEKDLRSEIAGLKKQLRERPTVGTSQPVEPALDKLAVQFERGAKAERKQLRAAIGRTLQQLHKRLSSVLPLDLSVRHGAVVDGKHSAYILTLGGEELTQLGKTIELLDKAAPVEQEPIRETRPAIPPRRERPIPERTEGTLRGSVNGDLMGPERRILDGIAWANTLGVEPVCNAMAAFAARYSPTSSAYTNPRSALVTAGLIHYPQSDFVALTDAGRVAAFYPAEPASRDELHRRVLDKLPGPQRRILEPLLAAYPKALTNEECSEAARYSATSSAYTNPRSALRSLGLLEYPTQGSVKAAKFLFPEENHN